MTTDIILIVFVFSMILVIVDIIYKAIKGEKNTITRNMISVLTGFYYLTNMPTKDWNKEPDKRKISPKNKVRGLFEWMIIIFGTLFLLIFILQGILFILGEPIDIGKELAKH